MVCLYPDRIQLQVRDNSGQSVDLEKKGIGLESGKTYDVQLGMYNVSETEVRILLTVDGKTVWDEVIENELLASSDYYFCCSSIQNTKISIGEKVVEPDKVSVGTLIADTDNWKSFNAEPVFDEGFMSLDTLTVDKTASAGYAGQKFKNSIFEFTYKAQTSAAQGQGWTGLYLDMNNPGTTYAWSIKGVLVTLYDNRSELQIYDNKGQTIVGDKTVPFEIGRTYQMQFGMYDVSDTEVRIIVTADGNTIWNEVIESELLVSAEKYFCITAALHNKAIVSASEEPEEDPAIPVIIPEESDKYVIYGNTATISSDADYRRLLNVMVDDEVADPSDYTVGARATATPRVGGNTGDSGTAVTFHRNYLENLSVGDHVVQLNYEEGKRASTILTVLPAADSDNYNIAVIGSQSKVVDEQAIISIMPYHADKETWNAVDLTLTYDTEKLTFATTTLEGYSIKHDRENGAIQIIGYGDDKACELDTIDLAFIADRVGDAAVTLISAKVDESGNAIAKDAPEASVAVAAATIRITGYPVTLPDGFVGEATVTPGEDYTFIAGNTNYDYVLAAEVNGEEVTITGSGTEQDPYTVKAGDLTGNLVIILKNRTPKTFAVIITEGADVTGDDQATYGEDYTFIIAKQDGYGYSMPAVTIGGQTYKAFSVSGNSYTIPGADIVGEIRIAVVKTALSADQVTVTVQGTGAGDVEAAAQAEKNTRFTFIVNKVSGYKYAVRATVDGRTVELTGAGTTENPYAIAAEDVTDNILITVDKELTAYTMRISVSEYLKLQERKSVFLVKAAVEGELPEGKIPAYDGNGMYWSEKYNAYCWLVISGNTSDAVEAEAKEKIVTAHANKVAIAYTGDVNLTGTVDVNDAQLAYDMYNAKYSDFVKTSAQKFLSADVNADGVVNVSDATAIVNIILSGK